MAEELKIEYDAEYFDLVRSLTPISQSICFRKVKENPEDDSSADLIKVLRCNKAKSIFFKLMAPADKFTFNGDDEGEIAFLDFSGFHKAMSTFAPATLVQKGNNIQIKSQTGNINYRLSIPSSLMKAPKNIDLEDPDLEFNLSAETLSELAKASDLVKAEFANILFEDGRLIIRLFNSIHGHSFDKEFHTETVGSDLKDFVFTIKSEIISRLPIDNYKVKVRSGGHLAFCFNRPNGLELMVFTSRLRNVEAEKSNG